MAKSICDQCAVIGMGCSYFGERFDASLDDLIIEAVQEALEDANIELKDIDAFWFGTFGSGLAGDAFSTRMMTEYKPVTRLENKCCSGTDAFRNACYAVASGVCDVAMAIGAEKLKDGGYSGLVVPHVESDMTAPFMSTPAAFSLSASAYAHKYGLSDDKLHEVLARISFKNHSNGALSPKAMYRKEVPMEKILKSPTVTHPLTVMDCSGVSDGCSCAIITRADIAKNHRKDPMYVKALQIASGYGYNQKSTKYDFTYVSETINAAAAAYKEAGVTNPREQISIAEVHDCFTITELLIAEDLGFSERGKGWQDFMDGVFDRDGKLPINIDGGLKSFGHPIGASGIRMIYEMWLQFHGRAGKRQRENVRLGMTHNMGGRPYCCVAGITICGMDLG